VHVLAGGGNRGKVKCLKHPEMPEQELGGKDFWFDPLTHEFGLEGGGAQYGMSFDNYGRKFGCSNSDHLQYWVYDDKYAARNPHYSMPPARKSIAVDGGAAEVFRLSPDEPWRIIRTRWRIAGVVKGSVEGGGRVSGYFTGATGTTIYRGDAYGPEFVNNSFTGDAGGQLIHRKMIRYAENGIELIGERPEDERGYEFAASNDTWVRVVNFANAPDGHLYVCDMYREVIEHPWSVPDEIKKHLDLNSGNDRGRIWRIAPQTPSSAPRGTRVNLSKADVPELVKTLGHPNGWHRDAASRLLYERQDQAAVPLLLADLSLKGESLAKIHALNVLAGLKALSEAALQVALADADPFVKERACELAESFIPQVPESANQLVPAILHLAENETVPRVRYQALLSLGHLFEPDSGQDSTAIIRLFAKVLQETNSAEKQGLQPAVLSADADLVKAVLRARIEKSVDDGEDLVALFQIAAASGDSSDRQAILTKLTEAQSATQARLLKAFATGLRRAGTSITKVDAEGQLAPVFTKAATTSNDPAGSEQERLAAIELLALAKAELAQSPLQACLKMDQPEAIQTAAVRSLTELGGKRWADVLMASWAGLKAKAREAALTALLAREESTLALLKAMAEATAVLKPADLTASQVQALAKHKNIKVSDLAKTVLASVIPPSREEVVKKFQPALAMKGDAVAGEQVFLSRCLACHVANGQGIEVGPNMTTVKTRGRDGLLTAILEPHKEVASQYIAYTVNTKDGQTLAGFIAKDDASSMTLKMMGGAEVTVQRSNILGSSSNGQSLMPEGLEQGMTVEDMADLLSFIETVK